MTDRRHRHAIRLPSGESIFTEYDYITSEAPLGDMFDDDDGDLEGLIDFWSPGRIADFLKRVDTAFGNLDRRIMASNVSDGFKAQWRSFYNEWAEYNEDHEGWFSRLSTGTVDDTERFERELEIYRLEFKNLGGSPGIDRSEANPKGLMGSPVVWMLGGALAAGAAAAYASRGKRRR